MSFQSKIENLSVVQRYDTHEPDPTHHYHYDQTLNFINCCPNQWGVQLLILLLTVFCVNGLKSPSEGTLTVKKVFVWLVVCGGAVNGITDLVLSDSNLQGNYTSLLYKVFTFPLVYPTYFNYQFLGCKVRIMKNFSLSLILKKFFTITWSEL